MKQVISTKGSGHRPTATQGFSLIELLIVVTVLGVLASIAVPAYSNARIASLDTKAKSDLRNAMTALDMYMARNDTYPSTESELEASTGFIRSSGVSFSKFELKIDQGAPSVHMHLQHADSPNAWHAHYPKDGLKIDPR
jgi:prepilin-type N-terminal cleavage/methylation domain-containing protein